MAVVPGTEALVLTAQDDAWLYAIVNQPGGEISFTDAAALDQSQTIDQAVVVEDPNYESTDQWLFKDAET